MNQYKIPEKIQSLIYQGKKEKALSMITQLINETDAGLFASQETEYVRFLNKYRVKLLRDWHRYKDALAYTCLECELYPDYKPAQAFRAYMVKILHERIPGMNGDILIQNHSPWETVAGMHQVKTIFEQDIIMLFKERELYQQFRIPMPNGMIMYGPPGCGKTYIAEKLAEEIGFNFMKVSPSDIGSTYVHGTQLEIKRIFDDAETNGPTLLFIDEIEAMVPNRQNSDVSHHYKSEVNEFLTQLNNCGKKEIFVVAATNYLNNIDPAILRPGRFDKKVFVGAPDLEARIGAFKIHLKGRPYEEIKWLFIGEMTEYFTFADIEYVVNEASRQAVKNRAIIDTNLLGKVISVTRPSLSEDTIKTYFT
jgi:transitional endoplasmic reticulum ATPase